MRVLLDVNVLLDALLQRDPWRLEADGIFSAAALGQVGCAVTTLSLATLFYVGRKTVGSPAARDGVRKLLATFAILPVDKQALLDADALPGNDFEDNILIAAAMAARLDAIVTRNTPDFGHAPVAVWAPAELLKRLAAPPPGPPGQP